MLFLLNLKTKQLSHAKKYITGGKAKFETNCVRNHLKPESSTKTLEVTTRGINIQTNKLTLFRL